MRCISDNVEEFSLNYGNGDIAQINALYNPVAPLRALTGKYKKIVFSFHYLCDLIINEQFFQPQIPIL